MPTSEKRMIRPEVPADKEPLFQLHFEAFGAREDESRLVNRIRESQQFIPELSLVAAENGEVIGHALFSKAAIVKGDVEHDVIVLAPIAVKPGFQKQGTGGALIRAGLQLAGEHGYSHVFLIGHPTYYPRFGFEPARPLGFKLTQFQVPDEVFMVHILRNDVSLELEGELRYPASFFS